MNGNICENVSLKFLYCYKQIHWGIGGESSCYKLTFLHVFFFPTEITIYLSFMAARVWFGGRKWKILSGHTEEYVCECVFKWKIEFTIFKSRCNVEN